MAKAKKDKPENKKIYAEGETKTKIINLAEQLGIKEKDLPLGISEMTIIEIMHQKNISREDAISFIRTNQNKK